jgi:phospholipase C
VPALPEGLKPAKQESGVRPARALPYRPQASMAAVDASGVDLALSCEGAAAVLHVYDRLRLDAVPRRYTLLPGMPLRERWPLDAQGRYDLWLLGPNGFHRHFQGAAKDPALQASLIARMANCGCGCATWVTARSRCVCSLVPMPGTCPIRRWYCPHTQKPRWRGTQRPRRAGMTCRSARASMLRLAGRAEDGRPGTSDPAMGSEPLRFEQD